MLQASRSSRSSLPADWGQHLRQELAAVDAAAALDKLSLGVIAAGLLRSWAVVRAPDFLFLACYAAATAGMLLWRRRAPASFAAWRELPAAAMRLAVAAAPTGWVITRQALSGAAPFSADGSPGGMRVAQDVAAFALLLFFSSFGATGSVLALARPLRLALHMPVQAATMALIRSRNADICATPILRHPAAQRMAAQVYSALSLLQVVLPAGALAAQHGAAGRCQAVLTMAELLFGFLPSTLVLAAQESRRYVRWQARWRRRWQRQRQQLRRLEQQQEAAEASTSKPAAASAQSEYTRDRQEEAGGAEAEAAAASEQLPPHVRPPGRLAAGTYKALYAGMHPQDPSDCAMLAVTATLLLCSAWHAILLATPAGPAS
ncbi:hypothetical protein ABPG75_011039 [Micractinium tetrahymenae]